ncbi:nuclear transport factor 2 family protein [Pseudoxanthomonas suwonensis]|uniref:SnoaL-like domain-containing protein n=1 Tax=Pseudoxanthomonas suwonensis TaxID=314722 RepID=A0A0E3UP91_9GAMM|nr:nuclear transport factor 2 family protein [Pseudoxanthomonas suwonensis]AKC87866.1 hypothetical protein WQ53_14950 [Pseudoxanthomonas suwonensis]
MTYGFGVFKVRYVAGCLLALLLLLGGCSRTPPEQRLREQLASMQEALEQRQASAFMDGVAADFAGDGGMDRAALQQIVRAQVLANARIGLTLGPAEIEVRGERATVRFSAVATGGGGRFLPDRAQAWDVTSGWRDEDGQWRLYYAEWTPL